MDPSYQKTTKPMKKTITTLLLLAALQSCIASKNYQTSSYDQRDVLFDSFHKKDKSKKVKIYLQNAEKFQLEKDSGHTISATFYCHSRGDINMQHEATWGVVESKAIRLGLEHRSPILFVCSTKEADFVYEYSYEEKTEFGVLKIFNISAFLGTLGIFPLIESPEYKISLSIKTKDNVLLKDLGMTEFKHTVFSSTALLPLAVGRVIKRIPTKDNVVAEMVLDKVLESLPELEKLINKGVVKK